MKPLLILHDKGIFKNPLENPYVVWNDRLVGKIVLFDKEGRVALIGNKVNDFLLLPGGGINKNETIIEGSKRECCEETGCKIEIIKDLGSTEDFRLRDGRHSISHGFSAKVVSFGEPHPEEKEKEVGQYVKWVNLNDTLEIFSRQEEMVRRGEVNFYNTCFNIFRDAFFVRRAKDLIETV